MKTVVSGLKTEVIPILTSQRYLNCYLLLGFTYLFQSLPPHICVAVTGLLSAEISRMKQYLNLKTMSYYYYISNTDSIRGNFT